MSYLSGEEMDVSIAILAVGALWGVFLGLPALMIWVALQEPPPPSQNTVTHKETEARHDP